MGDPAVALSVIGAGIAGICGVAYALNKGDPIKTAGYGLGTLATLGTVGYTVANTKALHKGKSGLGSCDTAESVLRDGFGAPEKAPLAGKIALVTGANSGIGLETALALVQFGATVVVPCRNASKFEDVVKEIVKRCGEASKSRVLYVELDLSDLDSVRKAADEFHALNLKKLDILILNAGIMMLPTKELTKQGYEKQVAVNHLGHFTLTGLLLNDLKASGDARVVAVSSIGYRRVQNIDWISHPKLESEVYDPATTYGMSKFSNMLFAKELNEKYAGKGIKAYYLHPGGIHTNLQVHVSPLLAFYWAVMTPFFFKSTKQGASTTVYCATHPKAASESGNYFTDCNVSPNVRQAWLDDAALRGKFWTTSEKLTGVHFD